MPANRTVRGFRTPHCSAASGTGSIPRRGGTSMGSTVHRLRKTRHHSLCMAAAIVLRRLWLCLQEVKLRSQSGPCLPSSKNTFAYKKRRLSGAHGKGKNSRISKFCISTSTSLRMHWPRSLTRRLLCSKQAVSVAQSWREMDKTARSSRQYRHLVSEQVLRL